MNIEEKKNILRSYKYHQEELERLYYQLNEIRVKCYNKAGIKAITYSDMPKGGTSPDMADEIANMIDLEKGIVDKILKLHEEMNRIDNAIDKLPNILEKRALKMHYINRFKQWQIARELYCEERTVRRILREGLERVKLS